jgi:hypothetical protein
MRRFYLAILLVALAILLMAPPLGAQDEKKADTSPKPVTEQKLFMLKYADPQNLRNLLQVFHADINANREMRVLTVEAPAGTMTAIEDAIKRLDVPSAAPSNIDLMVYLVVGHEGENTPASAPVPKDLDSVVAQLKNAFAFKNYNLLDVLALRTRTGQEASTTSSGGAIQAGTMVQPVVTSMRIGTASMGGDGSIHISNLAASIKMPVAVGNGFNYQDLGLHTDLDIKEGQKVVIGRLGIGKDQALFLVMTVKVVQ